MASLSYLKKVHNAPPECRTKRLRLTSPGYRLRMVWMKDSASPVLHKFLNLLDPDTSAVKRKTGAAAGIQRSSKGVSQID
jgi:hypothetical protein